MPGLISLELSGELQEQLQELKSISYSVLFAWKGERVCLAGRVLLGKPTWPGRRGVSHRPGRWKNKPPGGIPFLQGWRVAKLDFPWAARKIRA